MAALALWFLLLLRISGFNRHLCVALPAGTASPFSYLACTPHLDPNLPGPSPLSPLPDSLLHLMPPVLVPLFEQHHTVRLSSKSTIIPHNIVAHSSLVVPPWDPSGAMQKCNTGGRTTQRNRQRYERDSPRGSSDWFDMRLDMAVIWRRKATEHGILYDRSKPTNNICRNLYKPLFTAMRRQFQYPSRARLPPFMSRSASPCPPPSRIPAVS